MPQHAFILWKPLGKKKICTPASELRKKRLQCHELQDQREAVPQNSKTPKVEHAETECGEMMQSSGSTFEMVETKQGPHGSRDTWERLGERRSVSAPLTKEQLLQNEQQDVLNDV